MRAVILPLIPVAIAATGILVLLAEAFVAHVTEGAGEDAADRDANGDCFPVLPTSFHASGVPDA